MTVRTLDDHLRASAARTPDKIAIVAGDRRVSYGELDRLADGIAGGLIASGIERGDRVGVFLPNTVEGAASIYGVLRAGAGFSPLNPTMKAEKLGQVLADAGAAGIICESMHRGVVADAAAFAPTLRTVVCVGDGQAGDVPFEQLVAHEAPRSLRATAIDLAALIYTSGSTGKPKGVTLTHQNMTFAAASLGEYLEMQQDEVVLLCLPLSFDYGLYQLLLTDHGRRHARAREGLRLPGQGRPAARERGRDRPARRPDAVRRAARPARPRRARIAGPALPLEHRRSALGDDDRAACARRSRRRASTRCTASPSASASRICRRT